MLVELGLCFGAGESVEVGEEVDLAVVRRGAVGFGAPQEVVDQDLGVNLLLNVDGWGVDDEVGPILLVLAALDELGIEIAVPPFVGDAQGVLIFLLDQGLVFGGGDVQAGGFLMRQSFHTL